MSDSYDKADSLALAANSLTRILLTNQTLLLKSLVQFAITQEVVGKLL